ncbi:hypothetical protein LUZ60_013823 [Juncus effusus]|nr:hypothetical protein LUZ60_013823 [Juncus effusus]
MSFSFNCFSFPTTKPDNSQSNGGSSIQLPQIPEVPAAAEASSSRHTVKNIQLLKISIQNELEQINTKNRNKPYYMQKRKNKPHISRFPLHIRERKKPEIRPRVVSIGPFFHKDDKLKGMEKKKMKLVSHLLERSTDQTLLETLLKRISVLEPQARKIYRQQIELNDNDFVKMLLLDSCFIIYFIISVSREMHDSLISLDWIIKEIRSDLLLLENQIPLRVVCDVYSIIDQTLGEVKLPNFATILGQFIYMDIPWQFLTELPYQESSYLLELYWKCFLPDVKQPSSPQEISSSQQSSNEANFAQLIAFTSGATKNIPSATDLHRVAGVKFMRRTLPPYSRDPASYEPPNIGTFITFCNGVLEMPSLKIDESRKIILTNLIGYEKLIPFEKRKVSSYMLLMDSLINTEEDVELLQRRGIIANALSSNSCATIFFNEIGDLCTVDYKNHLFVNEFKAVNEYYNTKWNRSIAKLQQNYLGSPWAAISVFAGSFLLMLAGLQTFYTVYPYYHPR